MLIGNQMCMLSYVEYHLSKVILNKIWVNQSACLSFILNIFDEDIG